MLFKLECPRKERKWRSFYKYTYFIGTNEILREKQKPRRYLDDLHFLTLFRLLTLTLIRFQTKTKRFCSVFKKICVHTYRFRIVFARPHYNAVSVLKTLLYPQFSLHSSSTTFLATKLSHRTEVRPGLVQNLRGFKSSFIFIFPKLARSEALKYLVPFWRLSRVK